MENQEMNLLENNEIFNREEILRDLSQSHEILNGLNPETSDQFETKALLMRAKNLLTKTI